MSQDNYEKKYPRRFSNYRKIHGWDINFFKWNIKSNLVNANKCIYEENILENNNMSLKFVLLSSVRNLLKF